MAGASSAAAALSRYVSMYRRRWGCAAAVGAAHLRVRRAHLVSGQRTTRAEGTPGFDPGNPAHLDAAGRPVEGGHPAGQR